MITRTHTDEAGAAITKRRGGMRHQFRPSVTEGAARAFDIFGHMPVRRCDGSSPEAVWAAIREDWEAIGGDMWSAMVEFALEHDLDHEAVIVSDDPTA